MKKRLAKISPAIAAVTLLEWPRIGQLGHRRGRYGNWGGM